MACYRTTDYPYEFSSAPYTYTPMGTRFLKKEDAVDVVDFIPDDNGRNVKISLEKAKEWYQKGGELAEIALQAYSDNELRAAIRPLNWEEFVKVNAGKTGYFIDNCCSIVEDHYKSEQLNIDKNLLPSEDTAKAFLAYMQLMTLRKAWVGDWEPDWNSNQAKHCILVNGGLLQVGMYVDMIRSLSFPTESMAESFIIAFKDLLIEAKGLY
jgi:hypothetical protein